MKIAVDIDEVLCGFFEGYFNFHRDVYPDLTASKLEGEYVWDVFDISKEEALRLCDVFNSPKEFEDLMIIDGSLKGLNVLRRSHEIIFITSRPESLRDKTISFLEGKFFVEKPALFFSGDISGKLKLKGEICLEEGVDLIIEDSPNNSLMCAEKGIKVLLLDKPWNQNCEHKNLIRCEDWKDIVNKIREIEDEEGT